MWFAILTFLVAHAQSYPDFTEQGIASEYSEPQPVACPGYPEFDPKSMTAAHKTLACGTRVRVTNLNNGQSTVVKIVDRGPYVNGRIIDLSTASFSQIANVAEGLIPVRIETVTFDTPEGTQAR